MMIWCPCAGVMIYLVMTTAPIAQSAEAVDLKSIQCGFESHWGHNVENPGCYIPGFLFFQKDELRLAYP